MNALQILSLLLAFSAALHIAVAAGLLTHRSGVDTPQAILTGFGAAATSLALYFAAIAAYM
ncbi:hypothetical protein ACFZB2_37150 [Streptomyces bobili]|uniref:hypothetical protein n=1 Tax=Streptomyces bobili TaxID=67280 RepID=UPI0036E4BB44